MIKEGILTKADKVELIHGEILEMSPIRSKHAGIVKKINKLFQKLLGESMIVGVQNPLNLSGNSQPEPDISLLKFREDFYTASHPKPADVLLLIEVADSSVAFDREVKMPLYAEANIPEFWLIDLEKEVVEVYKQPQGGKYHYREVFNQANTIKLDIVDISFEVNSIFPSK